MQIIYSIWVNWKLSDFRFKHTVQSLHHAIIGVWLFCTRVWLDLSLQLMFFPWSDPAAPLPGAPVFQVGWKQYGLWRRKGETESCRFWLCLEFYRSFDVPRSLFFNLSYLWPRLHTLQCIDHLEGITSRMSYGCSVRSAFLVSCLLRSVYVRDSVYGSLVQSQPILWSLSSLVCGFKRVFVTLTKPFMLSRVSRSNFNIHHIGYTSRKRGIWE